MWASGVAKSTPQQASGEVLNRPATSDRVFGSSESKQRANTTQESRKGQIYRQRECQAPPGRSGNADRGRDDRGEVPPVSLAAMAREDWGGRGKQRRIFSQQFKLQVLDSYRRDSDCRGNQRATARKYGIHRRQIQKWLQVEAALRGGSVPPPPLDSPPTPPAPLDYSSNSRDRFLSIGLKVEVVDTYCQDASCCMRREDEWSSPVEERLSAEEPESLLVHDASEECLDLSKKRRVEEEVEEEEEKTLLDLDRPQETALCLVTREESPPAPNLWPLPPPRPPIYCDSCPLAYTDHIQWCHYPYYSVYHTSYVTKWLHQDAQYYKQAVKDINLYTPMYS